MFALTEIFLLLFLGLAIAPLPVGVPPLPENPALVRAAPADSVAFFEWFGSAAADPASRNATERLAAEAEVRGLVGAVRGALRAMVIREAGDDAALAERVFDGVEAMLRRPGCVFLFDMRRARFGPDVSFGMLVDLGQEAARIEAGVRAIAALSGDDDTAADAAGVAFRPLFGGEARWAIVDGCLAIAAGDGAAERLVGGLRAQEHRGLDENPRYGAAQSIAAVARPVFRSFVDLAAVLAVIGADNSELAMVSKLLGIDALQAIAAEGGLEGRGFVQRTALATDGLPALLGPWDGRALEPGDFGMVPADALFAAGFAASASDVLRQVFDTLESAQPGAAAMARGEAFGELSELLEVDVEQDLLAHLGAPAVAWSSPEQSGALLYNGLTVAIPLDDAAAFRAAFGRTMDRLAALLPSRADAPDRRHGFAVERIDGHAEPIWFLDARRDELPFAPAWCVTDDHLLLSVFPQNLVDCLAHAPAKSLATDPAFAAHVASGDGAVVAGLVDVGGLLPLAYPLAQIGAQLAINELRREGFDIDIGALPRLGALAPHLGRELWRVDVAPRGLIATRTGTLPATDPLLLLAVPMLGMRMSVARAEEVRQVRAQAALAVPVPVAPWPEAQKEIAKALVVHIESAAKLYRVKHGKVPTLAQLAEPDEDGNVYLKGDAAQPDPWGNPFTIEATDDGGIAVTSLGPDGQQGTADDISSR